MLQSAHGPRHGADYKKEMVVKGKVFSLQSSRPLSRRLEVIRRRALLLLLYYLRGARGVIDFTVESLAGHAICLFHIFHLQVANQLLIQFFVYLMFVSCTVFSIDAECI